MYTFFHGVRCILLYGIAGPLLAAFGMYRYVISGFLPKSCRFLPTCSEYCKEAIKKHGPFKGSWLTFKRLLRCHPFSKPAVDEVPAVEEKEKADSTQEGR